MSEGTQRTITKNSSSSIEVTSSERIRVEAQVETLKMVLEEEGLACTLENFFTLLRR